MSFKTGVRRNKERGIAMLIAMLAVVLLAIIGLGFMFMSSSENSVNNNFKDSQKSYFASRAGLENVRLMLVPPDPRTGLGAGPLYASAMGLTMPTAAANTGVLYVENKASAAENIDPTTASGGTVALNPNLDNELCKEKFPNLGLGTVPNTSPCDAGPAFPTANNYFQVPPVVANQFSNTNGALPFKWVRLTNKQNFMGTLNAKVDGAQADSFQVCWDGNKQYVVAPPNVCQFTASPAGTTTSMMPVWELTSLSVTPAVASNPGSRRITQMEVALAPPLIPNAPIATDAPVTFIGSYVVNAYDFCTCQCTTSGSGNNTTTTCGGPGCYDKAHAVETGGTVSINGSSGSTIANPALPSPYMQNVNPWPFDINDLINQYKQGATTPPYTCTGTPNFSSTPAVYASCGTQSSQQFGTYPASLNLNPPVEPSATDYNPVTTYIPGSVKLTADANGSGILIVDGDLEINGGMNYYGLILVRGKVSFTGGGSQAVNLYGSILAGEDVTATDTSVSDTFGGSINFHYDVCALKRSGGNQPPRLLATHEITF